MQYSLVIPLKLSVECNDFYDYTYVYSRHNTYREMLNFFISDIDDDGWPYASSYSYSKDDTFFINNNSYIYDVKKNKYMLIKNGDVLYLNRELKHNRKIFYNIILNSGLNVQELENLDKFIINLNNISFSSVREKKQVLEDFKNYLNGKKNKKDTEDTKNKEKEDYFIEL